MSTNNKDAGVRYCVTAIVDLLGFSSHLEVANNDLRTNIGQEAINRLKVLEDALQLIEAERKLCPAAYPETFHYIRINDSVIFTLDLPDLLRPSVGESTKKGLSVNELSGLVDVDRFEHEDEYVAAIHEKLSANVMPLMNFVGMLARFHSLINRKENGAYFPGARTIVATGYRRPFGMQKNEDFLSANFSFSNAYLAEQYLRGPLFFVDNNVSRLISMNRFARNLVRFGCYISRPLRFDPFAEQEDYMFPAGPEKVLSSTVDIVLFRKPFQFRELDPYPLSYLQIVPRLLDYLESRKEPARPAKGSKALGNHASKMLKSIISGPIVTEGSLGHLPRLRMDLEDDIQVFPELIESGESLVLKTTIKELDKVLSDVTIDAPYKARDSE